MITQKFKQLKESRSRESGNDVVTLVMVMPIVIAMIFTMIDLSYYLQSRSMIQTAAQDGARMVALYGGQSDKIPLNNTGKSVTEHVVASLYSSSSDKCIPSSCYQPPVVTCTPDKVTESMGLGTPVSCTVRYFFSPASAGLASMLGFGELLTNEIEVTRTSVSETYYMG